MNKNFLVQLADGSFLAATHEGTAFSAFAARLSSPYAHRLSQNFRGSRVVELLFDDAYVPEVLSEARDFVRTID